MARLVPTSSVIMVPAFGSNAAPSAFGTLGIRSSFPANVLTLTPGPARTIQFTPYGVGTPGQTFGIRLVGLRPVFDGELGGVNQIPLFEGLCTLGTGTGSSGTSVPETNHTVATVTAPVVGVAGVQFEILETGQSSTVVVDGQGCQQFFFEIGPGSATSGNVLVGTNGQ